VGQTLQTAKTSMPQNLIKSVVAYSSNAAKRKIKKQVSVSHEKFKHPHRYVTTTLLIKQGDNLDLHKERL
jgi:hypothetical protein